MTVVEALEKQRGFRSLMFGFICGCLMLLAIITIIVLWQLCVWTTTVLGFGVYTLAGAVVLSLMITAFVLGTLVYWESSS